ncbi:MAG: hypothetical protein DMF25_10895 [Verrucomicrobia bacterium]|nr:MAG: hypothetical protein DMF25_10895 [Verrucomicrobiota bacterium]
MFAGLRTVFAYGLVVVVVVSFFSITVGLLSTILRAQHDLAHDHAIAFAHIIDRCGQIWPNGRPGYGVAFRI